MRDIHKQLLIVGVVMTLLSATYLAFANVPNQPVPAVLFPLAILGLFFGIIAMLWSIIWAALESFRLVK